MQPTLKAGLALALLTTLGTCHPATAQHLYDASADFSAISNPSPLDSGVFSYGEELTLGGPFLLYTKTGSETAGGTIQGWDNGGDPALLNNTSRTAFSQSLNGSVLTVAPGQFLLHPGPNGEYSILRFTAPTTSFYSFSGMFNGADSHPTTTDVHVLLNNVSVANGSINVNGGGNTANLSSSSVFITEGQSLDFAVGYGNGTYNYDSTGLYAQVTNLSPAAVPEASTTVSFGLLLALGLGGAVIAAKKKKASA